MAERYFISIRDRHGSERAVPLHRMVTLGRSANCNVVLTDKMVSRNHVLIEWRNGSWWAEDLGSSQGTFFGEAPIQRVLWEPGTALRIADGAYHVTLHSETTFASEVNLQAVLKAASLLSGEVLLDNLLEQTLDILLALSGTQRGFIMLQEDGALEMVARRDLGVDGEQHMRLSLSSVKRVYDTREPIWIQSVASIEQLDSQHSVANLQLNTILCLPLTIQGKCIGVVYLDSREVIAEAVHQDTFEAIVSLCASAIERARLTEANTRNHVLATVGQVAGSIVHDFKNALFVVQGHAQLLDVLLPGDDAGASQRRHVTQILEAVDRLMALSTEVLDYTRFREPQRESLDFATYLQELAEPMIHRASAQGIQVALEGPSCNVSLDRHRFARVVENLVENALDAAEGRPDAKVELIWEIQQEGVALCVKDNGVGIPKKVLKRIYEPYFSHGKHRGTGLGMATVKRIMEEHQGTIHITSVEGVGTTVHLMLPTAPEDGPDGENTGIHMPLEAQS